MALAIWKLHDPGYRLFKRPHLITERHVTGQSDNLAKLILSSL